MTPVALLLTQLKEHDCGYTGLLEQGETNHGAVGRERLPPHELR
jgi:hypothetical protein